MTLESIESMDDLFDEILLVFVEISPVALVELVLRVEISDFACVMSLYAEDMLVLRVETSLSALVIFD